MLRYYNHRAINTIRLHAVSCLRTNVLIFLFVNTDKKETIKTVGHYIF